MVEVFSQRKFGLPRFTTEVVGKFVIFEGSGLDDTRVTGEVLFSTLR